MALLAQPAGEQRCKLRLVLDDEHAHGLSIVLAACEATMNHGSSELHLELLH